LPENTLNYFVNLLELSDLKNEWFVHPCSVDFSGRRHHKIVCRFLSLGALEIAL
jgi:hypothetical protein